MQFHILDILNLFKVDLYYLISDKHLKCLKFLLSTENQDEKTVKSILALHYFAPLVQNCTYMVDSAVKCQCNVTPVEDNTCFGKFILTGRY